ncbi:MAG: hypothetical protein K2L17_02015 [Muribaculaceae bacterium]|nr:hypothetical protein [Muribaculaceae bacterium]
MMNISKIDTSVSKVADLTSKLSRSIKRPSRRTLQLIDRALSYLTPFESPRASVTSHAERQDLLTLLENHRMSLCPYIDVDKIESNLKASRLIVNR